MTLTPEQIQAMLEQVPEEWRPLFACGPALGLRKGELFALRKADVDLTRGTVTVARSHDRNATKGGDPAVLPLPAPLRPWIEYQLEHAPGPLLFPTPDGSQRSREADPQKVLRHALARAGIVEGYEHRCRWCKYSVRAADNECRYCPNCVKRTDGRGRPLIPPRGRMLWPKAIHVGMRFHDLRHGFATELLRRGVDVHRVQRLMRHSDVRITTGTYGHLVVEDLRAAVDAHTPLRLPPGPSAPASLRPKTDQEVGFSAPYKPQSSQKTASAQSGEIVQARGLPTGNAEWAQQGLNLRPLPCEGSALPLSYTPKLLKSLTIDPKSKTCTMVGNVESYGKQGSHHGESEVVGKLARRPAESRQAGDCLCPRTDPRRPSLLLHPGGRIRTGCHGRARALQPGSRRVLPAARRDHPETERSQHRAFLSGQSRRGTERRTRRERLAALPN